jgi:signal transduction histidine kinase
MVKVRGKLKSDEFWLIVSDNGPGLDDTKKKELFEPTRRYGGVGLHLVRRLAEKYGSTPQVEDRVKGKPDQGLTIKVRFSIAE